MQIELLPEDKPVAHIKLHTALNRMISATLSIVAMLLTTQGFAASLAKALLGTSSHCIP